MPPYVDLTKIYAVVSTLKLRVVLLSFFNSTTMIGRLAFTVLLALVTLITNAQNSPSFISDSLDTYIQQGLKDWNIPGLAIAIVKDGKVVVMKGYGVRDVQTKEPVDENTLFQIASNSKLFTATSIAQLAYDKKLSLDDKITKYIKDYRLYDKTSTDLVTIRDLLSHHIGTKTFQGDFVFWNGNLSRQQIMYKMRLLKPTGVFRKDFGYCNSCFLTAGEVIPIVSGKPWEVYVYDSLLMPLKMTNTHTLGQGINQRPNVAKPYTTVFTGKLTALPYDKVDNLAPAGSIVSNVKDLTHWLMMQLDSGRYEGERIVPWKALQATRTINTTLKDKPSFLPITSTGYGLGLFISNYNNHPIYYHTGGADGFVTNTCFVPDQNLGITILTNNDNQDFFEALRYQLLDAYLGVPYSNRSKTMLAVLNKQMDETVEKTEALKARVGAAKLALPIEAYTGTYENEIYGPISITKNKDQKSLTIDFKGHNNLKATLQYMDKDEWLLTYNNAAYGIFPVKFKIANNKVISIETRVNEFLDYDAYEFIKK
jgi:CubicO group peptidase (beta-lactamase class C family)